MTGPSYIGKRKKDLAVDIEKMWKKRLPATSTCRKEMLNMVAPSVKGQALPLARCAMEASFQCWQTGSESPTGPCAARLATKAVCSRARSVLPDQHRRCELLWTPNCFTSGQPRCNAGFRRWERHIIHVLLSM